MFCNDTALYVSLKLIYDKKCVFHVLACEKNVRVDMNLSITPGIALMGMCEWRSDVVNAPHFAQKAKFE